MSLERPEQLADGLTLFPVRTPTLPPATHTNAYLVGTAEFVVVEPASPYSGEQDELWGEIRTRLARGARCRAILLTHHHPDHVGGLDALRENLKAPVLAHPETARLLGEQLDGDLNAGDTLELWSGAGRPDRQLDVFHTPGHAPGHLCFVDRASGAGIVGDMVASVGTILIDPSDGDMVEYLASLERMKEFGMSQMLPAHGRPLSDPEAVLDHYVAHRLMREGKVVAALEELGRPGSLQELVPIAYSDTPAFLHGLAARSLESHLRKLVREGRAALLDDGRYSLSR